MAKKDKVVKRNDGVNGLYSKKTLDNGSTVETLSRRNPNETVTYTERFITPQQDTSYYIYNNTTPPMDRYVIGGKYVTPTEYNNMGWLGKRIIAGVRPESWDAKFDSYQEPVDSFQQGGEAPSNDTTSFLESLPYGRHNVDRHNKLVEMGKRFGNRIPGSIKPASLPNTHQPDIPPVKMPTYQPDASNPKPVPMPTYPGEHRDNKFIIPQEMYQEGGNLPSNDQQQLFVEIITDMAQVLGVEPSQELAEAVITAFENNDDSQGLITLFTQIKDKRMQEAGLFREGGKMKAFVDKFKCGGKAVKKATKKKQDGGEIEQDGSAYMTTRVNQSKARRDWRKANDATRKEARRYQKDLANNLENMGGISGRSAMNSAAALMVDPRRFASEPSAPRYTLSGPQAALNASPELNGPVGELNFPVRPEPTPAPVATPSFNEAFAAARKSGARTFMWNGKNYSTMTKEDPEYGKSPSPVGWALAQDNAQRELENMLMLPKGETYYEDYMNNAQPHEPGWGVRAR